MRRIQETIDCVTLNKPWYKHISHDLYDIAGRIREIDDGYFILFNRKSGKYEVHHVDSYPRTYQFLVPFPELDARTLEHCKRTLVQNSERLLAEMDKRNQKIEETKMKNANNEIESIGVELATDLRRAVE